MALEPILIKPRDLIPASVVTGSDMLIIDNGLEVMRATATQVGNAGVPVATNVEAIEGLSNSKRMTPYLTKLYIDSVVMPDITDAVEAAQAAAAAASAFPLVGRDTIPQIYADTSLTMTPGQPGSVVLGQRVFVKDYAVTFEVVSSGGDLTTPGGVRLRLIPKGDRTDFIALRFDTTGATDMSAVLTAYLARMPAIVTKLPGGTVRIDSTVVVPSDTSIDYASTKFNLSNLATGTPAFKAAGAVASTVNLNVNAVKGELSISLTSNAGLAPGRWIKLRSDSIFDPARTSSKCGELCQVFSISGSNVVNLVSPLADSYALADVARVEILNIVQRVNLFGNADFDGGGLNNRKAIHIEKAVDCHISNQIFRKFSDRAIWLQDVSNVNGDTCTFEDFDAPSTGYGVSFIDAAQDCRWTGLTGQRVRHLVATNNTSAGGGVPRRIVIDGFMIDASAYATVGSGGDAMDTHAASEEIHFWNGVVVGATGCGVIMEGAGGSIKNVHIRGALTHGIYAANFSGRKGRIEITGCTTQDTVQSGIRAISGSSMAWEYIKIEGIVERAGAFPVYAGASADIDVIDIDATAIDSDGGTQVIVQRAKSGRIKATVNKPRDTTGALYLMRLRDCENLDVSLVGDMNNNNTASAALFIDVATGTSNAIACRFNVRNAQAFGSAFRIGAGVTRLRFDSPGSIAQGFAVIPLFGTGSPEGAVAAGTGAIYQQTDAPAWARDWTKATGSGDTGWVLQA